MPNRIIKESICVSEQIDELSSFEENFFYRLLVNCDDYGCMDAREKVLAAKLYPLRALRPKEILNAVYKLADVGLIGLYEVEEHPYLKVLKWADHQRVRISKHKYPEPTEEQLAAGRGDSRQVAASCGELRQDAADGGKLRPESNPIQSNPNTNPNTNPNPNTNTIPGTHNDNSFALFWEAYPKKVSNPDAEKAWKKLNPDDSTIAAIMAGLAKWKQSGEWSDNDGQFIPYPASWLNKRRWEDEVPKRSAVVPVKKVVAQQYTQREIGDEDMEAAMERMRAAAGWDTGG